MAPGTNRWFKRSSVEARRQTLEVLKDPDKAWSVDHLKGLILEAEERLHLQQIWQRAGRAWLVAGNLILGGLAVYPLIRQSTLSRYEIYVTGALLMSVVISPIAVYQQYKRTRSTRLRMRQLTYIYRRKQQEQDGLLGGDAQATPLVQQKRYREDMLDLMAQFREEAKKNRKMHNRLQSVIIVGSVVTSAITTASISYRQFRISAVVISMVVGLAAGFMGYFKYHDRSFNSQQTADAIEREYESVILRVGKYKDKTDEQAYTLFAEVVERIRDEQNKRQQQLDQPVEARRDERPISAT